MTQWLLGEPFLPAISGPVERFLLKGTAGGVEGVVYAGPPPEWVPGDNSGGFGAVDLREIADLLETLT